jgi:hypothetical protein
VKGGCRRARITEHVCIFPTWQEAKDHLVAKAQAEVDTARRVLERCNGHLGNMKGLKEPQP